RLDVLHATEPDIRHPKKRRLCVRVDEHIVGLVPGSSEDVTLAGLRFGPDPLLHVARHVVVTPRAHVWLAADRQNTRAPEVACRHDERSGKRSCSPIPVIDRGQTLAGKLRISRRFIPADPSNRKIILSFGIFALDPVFRSGPTSTVSE